MGLICHDVGDPCFAGITGGMMRAAAEQGLLVMLASTFREPAREIAYVSMLRAQRARAILLIGSGFQDPVWKRAMDPELEPYVRAGGRAAGSRWSAGTGPCGWTPYSRRTGPGRRRPRPHWLRWGTGRSRC
ncbi:hypothetical protein [Streptomyces sp. SM11]|uniref:hypothetical protein n=1 Tax=Streptomyces sp. SM11 TaxID=565557 RepID=UPI002156184D|nr:hypothetical protein [Streptomyces sp. SM11]